VDEGKAEGAQLEACVIGATGLVGSALLRMLSMDPRWSKIRVLSRRHPESSGPADPLSDERVSLHLVDFADPTTWEDAVRGDVLFSALGTTIRKAGSTAAQHAVDHGIQLAVAGLAAARGFQGLVLVSSSGADPDSRIFYLRMKGEIDRDISGLSFPWIRILRPGPLDGPRTERRVAESVGVVLARGFAAMGIARDHRPIEAATVARAMIHASDDRTPGVRIWGPADLFSLGDPLAAKHPDLRP